MEQGPFSYVRIEFSEIISLVGKPSFTVPVGKSRQRHEAIIRFIDSIFYGQSASFHLAIILGLSLIDIRILRLISIEAV